jgi:predicted lipid-binding transport protein (Tim44 family)
MKRSGRLTVIGLALAALLMAHVPAVWARAGGGGSVGGGGRGSRSYSAPARPAPTTPTSPSRSVTNPSPASSPVAPARPSFFGGLMGGIAGFALGGLLGSMLFGHGFGGGFGGGFGLLELLLVGGAVFLLFSFLRRRRAAEVPTYGQRPAYAMAGGPGGYDPGAGSAPAGSTVETEPPASTMDLERGLSHIRQMDAGFDPTALVAWARGTYLDVQTTLKSRDVSSLRDRLAPEIYAELQAQCDHLRSARQTNVVERIDIRRSDVTEAWQETGRDYLTVYFSSSMLDYTVDDATGAVVAGSKSEPQAVEEFWTFTRPVGRQPWQLSAIQAA